MFAHLADRFCRFATPATAGDFLGQKLHGAVHANGEHLVQCFEVRIGPATVRRAVGVFDIGAVAPDIGPDHHPIFRVRADLTRQRQQHDSAFQLQLFGGPVLGHRLTRRFFVLFGDGAALHIGAEAPFEHANLVAHILAQQFAIGRNSRGFGLGVGRAEGAGIAAFRVVRAADERAAGPCGAHGQTPNLAVGAQARVATILIGREEMRLEYLVDLLQHLGDAQIGCFRDRSRKILPEPAQHILIVGIRRAHLIKLVFQIGGEIIAHIFAEVILEEGCHQPALVLGEQTVAFLTNVFAVLNGGDNAGIGRRAPDSQLFHALDQCRFSVAGGRLGKVLLWRDRAFVHLVALGDLRQALVILVHDIVAAFFVDAQEAVEFHHLTGGAQPDLFVLAADLYRGAFQTRTFHLAGQRALPDQIVQLALIRFGQFQRVGIFGHVGGAHTFVRLLRVLGLVLVDTRFRRDVFCPEPVRDGIPCHRDRLGGHVDAVGPHIGDVTGFIEPLRCAHGLACAHAELAAGFLLQRRRHERGRGVAARGFCLDAGNRQIAAGNRLYRHLGLRFIAKIKTVQLLTGKRHQTGLELLPARRGDQRLDAPVFAVAEGLDLHLALDDQPQGDRLYPPR